jgi:Tfp pilus assembly protein PilF
MKKLKFILLFLVPTMIYGQQMTFDQWEKEALTDKRLLPKYGNISKSKGEYKADKEFLAKAIELDTTAEKASKHMIDLGFQYLYRDMKTAMYRFNQAYLLDSTNSDIYWGFGAIYFMLNRLDLAREQYEHGLKIDPSNTRILTDFGTTYMSEYFANQNSASLDKAISILSLSYSKDPTNQNTSYKLSSCFLMKNDCENAIKFYEACMSLGGNPVTEVFKNEIEKRCK